MARIVVTEFMDERAVSRLAAQHEVLYEPSLVDDIPRLLAQAKTFQYTTLGPIHGLGTNSRSKRLTA